MLCAPVQSARAVKCLGSRLARTAPMPGQRWRSQVMAASDNWVNCYTPLGESGLRIKLVWNDRWPCDHNIGAMGAEFSECMLYSDWETLYELF